MFAIRFIAAAPTMALCLALSLPALAEQKVRKTVAGPALALDGDTIVIAGHDRRIRLFGIDAPEMRDWPAGQRSRDVLDGLIGRNARLILTPGRSDIAELSGDAGAAACAITDDDGHGRDVAICWPGGKALDPNDPEAIAASLNARMLAACAAATYRIFLDWPADDVTRAFLAAEARCGGDWR